MVEDGSNVPEIEQLRIRSPLLFESIAEKEWAHELIRRLADHSRWTFEHSVRVAQIVGDIADFLSINKGGQLLLVRSGLLHDIGKLQVLVDILDSVALREAGRKALDNHPRIGFDTLKELDYEAARIIIAHHEFQTRAYPRRRARAGVDSELVFSQSLIALADATDALLSERPYKSPWSSEETSNYLESRFDSKLIEISVGSRTRM